MTGCEGNLLPTLRCLHLQCCIAKSLVALFLQKPSGKDAFFDISQETEEMKFLKNSTWDSMATYIMHCDGYKIGLSFVKKKRGYCERDMGKEFTLVPNIFLGV